MMKSNRVTCIRQAASVVMAALFDCPLKSDEMLFANAVAGQVEFIRHPSLTIEAEGLIKLAPLVAEMRYGKKPIEQDSADFQEVVAIASQRNAESALLLAEEWMDLVRYIFRDDAVAWPILCLSDELAAAGALSKAQAEQIISPWMKMWRKQGPCPVGPLSIEREPQTVPI